MHGLVDLKEDLTLLDGVEFECNQFVGLVLTSFDRIHVSLVKLI